jgi:rhomboid protease GluP
MQPDSIHYSENREPRRQRLYINRKIPLVTYVLAAVTVLVFLADQVLRLITGYPLLTLMGAKLNSAIIAGQWWRLVTPMFLHADFFHILFNMFALVIWGRQLEALMGRTRYAAIYFLSGILGCAASFAFSNSLSVGASGAIFGLFGALLYFRRQHREIFNAVFGVQVLVIIGINIANGFLVPNIDNFGHLGGMAGGFIACGITGFFGQRQNPIIRYGCLLGYSVLLLGLIALRYYGIT